MDLKAVQGIMVRLIASRDSLDQGKPNVAVEELIKPSARGMTPEARVEIYRMQFWTRHLENLGDDFPTLIWAIGGVEAFRQLASDYLVAHPPRDWDLQRLGVQLPAFVAASPRWNADQVARAAANLDWAFMEAFDAADAAPVDPSALAALREEEWPSASVILHPSLRLLALEYPLHLIRNDLTAGRTPERPARTVTHVAVWRDHGCALQATSIDAGAFAILVNLRGGLGLGQACESAARATAPDARMLDASIGPWFQEWTARGWISGVVPAA